MKILWLLTVMVPRIIHAFVVHRRRSKPFAITRPFASVSGILYRAEESDDDDETTSPISVTLFTKEGCTLCDKVVDVLQELRSAHPHSLTAVDITDADRKQYYEKYKYDIPVLHLNNQYWIKHRLTKEQAIAGFTALREGTFQSPKGEPNAANAR